MAKNNPQELMDSQLDFIMQSLGNGENGVACRWAAKPATSRYYKLPFYGDISPKMTVEEYRQSTCDPRDLAMVFHASYQRSGDDAAKLQERVDAAERWYRYFTE